MKDNEDLPPVVKLKFISVCVLFVIVFTLSTAFYVNYQRNAKAEAAELAKTQLANVEAMKTVFPSFRDSKQFKERVKMAMVKISVEDLPTTITAGLDETVSPNPGCLSPAASPDQMVEGWRVYDSSNSMVAENEVLDGSGDPGHGYAGASGWSFSGGSVTIPVGTPYGKYTVRDYGGSCENSVPDGGPGTTVYYYVFKITPPCPTGVTLTHAGS